MQIECWRVSCKLVVCSRHGWHSQCGWMFLPLQMIFFQIWEQMVVWRDQIRWIGTVLQHFKMQISQLTLCDGSRVWGGDVLEKHFFGQLLPKFGNQRLLRFVQERCIVACYDCCTLFEIINQQYTIFAPENRCHHLGDWLLCSKLSWTEWTAVSPRLRLFFCLWIIQMYSCFIYCHTLSQETAVFRLKCSRIAREVTTPFWSTFSHFGARLAESFPTSNTS